MMFLFLIIKFMFGDVIRKEPVSITARRRGVGGTVKMGVCRVVDTPYQDVVNCNYTCLGVHTTCSIHSHTPDTNQSDDQFSDLITEYMINLSPLPCNAAWLRLLFDKDPAGGCALPATVQSTYIVLWPQTTIPSATTQLGTVDVRYIFLCVQIYPLS